MFSFVGLAFFCLFFGVVCEKEMFEDGVFLVGVGLSRLVFARILHDILSVVSLDVVLAESDREQLYQELLYYFGLVGGLNVCEALEHAWLDPYNRGEIEDFIIAWLRKKAKKKEKAPVGVV